ncbi:MAG: hypothetical protein HDT39_06500 [Lachnospiraceae bacterium]|nr:hypothetical protein [Lachnospiraceae bacterium]
MKKILYSVLVIDFIIMVLNIVEIVHEAFFRDVYATIEISDRFTYFFEISFILTFIIFLVSLFLLIRQEKGQTNYIFKIIGVIGFLLLIVTNIYFGMNYYATVKPYSFNEIENQDYMPSEYFRGISLDELQRDLSSDSEILIYIGRDDCKQCKEFETELERILEEYHTEIPAYYTTQDREGSRSEEMYDILDMYNIGSVPIVILVQDSDILKIWDNPIEQLEEIKSCL